MRIALAAFLVGLVVPGLNATWERDAAGVAAAQTPRRIVSIGGDVTETLYMLGHASEIVAIDSTSQYPPQALKEKTSVGYMRALSPEGVVSAGGTVIIASDKAGPADVVKALKSSLKYVEIGEGGHPEAVPEKIKAIARAIDEPEAGNKLAGEVERDLEKLAQDRARIDTPLRTLFVLNMQGGRLMVAGKETSADAMLRLAGLVNVAKEINGYKPVGEEALLAMSPQLVLIMKAVGVHDPGAALDVPALAATPAGRDKRIVYVDGGNLLSFGPRVASLARDLLETAYPHLAQKGGTAR